MLHIAKIVGPASFGLWNLAQAWVLYLFRLGELGLEVVGIRTIARQEHDVASVVWTVVLLRVLILAALICGIIVFVWRGLFPEGSGQLIIVLSLTLLPLAFLLEWVFESHQTVGSVGITRIVRGILFYMLVLTCVTNGDQILDVAYYYVISFSTGTLILGYLAVKKFKLHPVMPQFRFARQLFVEGLPIGIATVLSNYSFFIGTILIGYLVGGKELGYYTAAHRLIVFFWAYGIATAHRVLLPRLSKLFRDPGRAMDEFILKGFRVICIASLPFTIVGITGGDQIIRLLYGSQYGASGTIFKILGAVLVITTTRSIFEIGLLASNRQNLFMQGMICVAFVATTISYIAISRFGIEGAAWASLITESVYACYLFVITRFGSLSRIFSIAWKPVSIAMAVTLGMLALGLESLYIIIPGGFGVYAILLLATKQVTSRDIDFALGLIGMKLSTERIPRDF